MQLSDPYGVPVPGTQFWVTLNIIKDGPNVTIQLPQINFQTGPIANASYEIPYLPPPLAGGYIYTSDGFLPEDLRPTDIVYRSRLAPSDNGALLSYTFEQDPSTIVPPITGYIVSITNAGGIAIQGAGNVANIIPPGNQALLPTDISYLVQTKYRLRENTKISTGPTNTTQFPASVEISPGLIVGPAGTGLRDTHVNAAYNGVAAWVWSDNSNIADKTNGTLNVMVAIGKMDKNGKLKVGKPVQLTDNAPGYYIFDTAVAINPTNPKNIVVSWGLLNFPTTPYRAVSFDGGKTWPYNGLMNVQPTGEFLAGDNRGIAVDKFGNFWYSTTNNATVPFNTPYFCISTDGGITFELVYTLPTPSNPNLFGYDYPQFCFGGDGQGNYGLLYTTDYFDANNNGYPVVGFIPIYGLGSVGTPTQPTALTEFSNNLLTTSFTASQDGRNWRFGAQAGLTPALAPTLGTAVTTLRNVFKSPGPQDQNYAGPWDYAYLCMLNYSLFAPVMGSQPVYGYILNSIQSNIFDDSRQALYQLVAGTYPDHSQNMRLYFNISRDNAQTWSSAININNTDFANRGFQSMALDPVRGDIYFGWYDGRNDPTYQSVEYYAAVIPAKALSTLVKKIPLSNPLYTLPSSGVPFSP